MMTEWRWRGLFVWSAPMVREWGFNRGRWFVGVAHRLTDEECADALTEEVTP